MIASDSSGHINFEPKKQIFTIPSVYLKTFQSEREKLRYLFFSHPDIFKLLSEADPKQNMQVPRDIFLNLVTRIQTILPENPLLYSLALNEIDHYSRLVFAEESTYIPISTLEKLSEYANHNDIFLFIRRPNMGIPLIEAKSRHDVAMKSIEIKSKSCAFGILGPIPKDVMLTRGALENGYLAQQRQAELNLSLEAGKAKTKILTANSKLMDAYIENGSLTLQTVLPDRIIYEATNKPNTHRVNFMIKPKGLAEVEIYYAIDIDDVLNEEKYKPFEVLVDNCPEGHVILSDYDLWMIVENDKVVPGEVRAVKGKGQLTHSVEQVVTEVNEILYQSYQKESKLLRKTASVCPVQHGPESTYSGSVPYTPRLNGDHIIAITPDKNIFTFDHKTALKAFLAMEVSARKNYSPNAHWGSEWESDQLTVFLQETSEAELIKRCRSTGMSDSYINTLLRYRNNLLSEFGESISETKSTPPRNRFFSHPPVPLSMSLAPHQLDPEFAVLESLKVSEQDPSSCCLPRFLFSQ